MKERIITKNFCLAFLAVFCSAMVMYMLMSTITEYVTAMGTTATLAGLVSGMYIFGGLCSRLGAGPGLTKLGWKRMALIAMAVHLVACVFYFVVDHIALLILVRLIHGMGFGAASTAINTIGMSVLPKSRYGEATAYFMMAPPLAIALGPFLGGVIYDSLGPTGCFAGATLMSFLMIVFTFFLSVDEIDPGSRKNRAIAAARASKTAQEKKDAPTARGLDRLFEVKAFPIAFCAALCGIGYVSMMSFYRLYAAETTATEAFSYFFLIYAVMLILTRLCTGRILDRFGPHVILIPGYILQFAGLCAIALYPSLPSVVLCAFGFSMGFGSMTSVGNALICRDAAPERRPFAVTTFFVCLDGATGLSPALLGAVATAAGYSSMYVCAAVISLAALPLYCITQILLPKKAAKQ